MCYNICEHLAVSGGWALDKVCRRKVSSCVAGMRVLLARSITQGEYQLTAKPKTVGCSTPFQETGRRVVGLTLTKANEETPDGRHVNNRPRRESRSASRSAEREKAHLGLGRPKTSSRTHSSIARAQNKCD